MKLSIKDFFGRCDQIRSFLRIWSHLLKESLMKSLISCAVKAVEVVGNSQPQPYQYHNEKSIKK